MTTTNTQPSIETLIQSPLTIVDQILQRNIASHGFKSETVQATIDQVHDLYQSSFSTPNSWSTIPMLNGELYRKSKVQRQSLVRVRCMVQDMMDQEMFPGVFRCSKTRYSSALFRDEIDAQDTAHQQQLNEGDEDYVDGSDPRNFILADRSVIYGVPIPGESSWAKHQLSPTSSNSTDTATTDLHRKRSRNDDDKHASEVESMDVDDDEQEQQEEVTTGNHDEKRVKIDGTAEPTSDDSTTTAQTSVKQAYTLDYPLPGETEIPYLIKLFDSTKSTDKIALCDIIEVVGILAENTALFADEYNAEDANELLTVYPPQSLVPRVHCIMYRKVSSVHRPFADTSKFSMVKSTVPTLRSTVIAHIAQAFHCDTLVGEFVLLHMLSRIYSNVGSMKLGKLVLNITRCPTNDANFAANVEHMFSSLLPASFLLRLSHSNLSQLRFGPRKDFQTNKLRSGVFQLATGTQLIVDENALEQGAIKENSLLNMQLLQALVNQSIVCYDFVYNRMELPCDLNVCILSDGRSVFKLGVDCTVPMVSHNTPSPSTTVTHLANEQLELARMYISLVNSMNAGHFSDSNNQELNYVIDARVAMAAESEFVEARNSGSTQQQSGAPQITVDDFHRWLSLARLVTMSHCDTQLTMEHWSAARHLERERSNRVAQYHPASSSTQ